ncbi:MAG: peptide ABC transporter substrate-binding protein [Faecalimonas sp.]|nr:peptide ABC transporter substrate-binding protein [Faecalimonas sp.]
MKRVLALVLAVSMLATLVVGCGKDADTNKNGSAEKQLAVQIGPDPETIDPALNSAVDGGNMILHTFEGLLTVNEKGEIAEGQAEEWSASEDGLTWTFKLRDGLKWSDGTDLTAEDFVYSWRRVADPLTGAPYAETVLGMVKGYAELTAKVTEISDAAEAKGEPADFAVPEIEALVEALGVKAVDEKTLEVTLAAPCTFFDSLAAFATLSPVQKATIEANGDKWATSAETYVSNGAFNVTEWVPGSHIIVSKNENYWNKDAIKLDSIKFVLMEDANAAYSAYQNGTLLLAKDVPTEEIPSLKDNDEFVVETICGTYYLSLNDAKAPFDNVNIRKALSLAIDRDYVANDLMQGTYVPAYNFMGPGWADPTGGDFMEKANGGKTYISEDYDANLAEAKKLMEAEGYSADKRLTFTYSTNDAGYHKVVAQYLQDAWKEIYVDVKVEIVEWQSFTPMRRAGDYDASRNGWVADYFDPSNMLDLLFSTNGNNDGKFNDADYDAAMTTSRTTVDPEARSKALHDAEDILMEKAACIPVAYYADFWLQSPKLTGSWHTSTGYWYFHYADIAE